MSWHARWERAIADGHVTQVASIRHNPARLPARGLPGSRLKRLLEGPPFWIAVNPTTCGCNDRAAQMNRWGVSGCRANQKTIVNWVAAEARKRRIPLATVCALLVVEVAIRLAEADEIRA